MVFGSRSRDAQYELLPSNGSSQFNPASSSTASNLRRFLFNPSRRRVLFLCGVGIAFLVGVVVVTNPAPVKVAWSNIANSDPEIVKPPTYERFYELERNYPQHDPSLPPPEGENGRYMWISNQHWGLGWNNIFQTLYMMAQMAYLSNRGFVFEPYTWQRGPEPFVDYHGHLIPSRIPLSALVDGPIAGGPFPPGDNHPRAVTIEYFDKICPYERRTFVEISEMNKGLDGRPINEVLEKYVEKLSGMNETCVEVRGGMEHPFDWQHFGDKMMETVWPTLSQSPILTEFRWAQLILSAVRTNAPIISPALSSDPPPVVVPDLMAVHIRRGDYIEHCDNLAGWGSGYMGWSQSPGIIDRFVPGNSTEAMEHCYPDDDAIVKRINDVRREWETRDGPLVGGQKLRKLYILTNGKRDWVKELKKKIENEGDWDVVVSSRDLTLSHEQVYVAQAVDMAIAQSAGVFIGNGYDCERSIVTKSVWNSDNQ